MKRSTGILLAILVAVSTIFVAERVSSAVLQIQVQAQPAHSAHHNAITLYGEVNDESAADVIEQIHAANALKTNAPVPMYIDSLGGQVNAGGKIIDAMLVSRRPIYTIAVGEAASMAAIIHSYGAKRFMFPHAVLMFHWAHTAMEGDVPRLHSRLALIQKVMDGYDAHVCEVSDVTLDELRGHEALEWYLLPQEALDRRLIDAIADVRDYPAR